MQVDVCITLLCCSAHAHWLHISLPTHMHHKHPVFPCSHHDPTSPNSITITTHHHTPSSPPTNANPPYTLSASVRILVKDAAAATVAFGPYVQPIEGSVNDPTAVRKALNGAKTVIIPSKTGALLPELTNAATSGRARDVVLISSAGAPGGGLLSVFDADGAVLRDTAREASVREAVPGCTVVRAARIRDVPGGVSGIAIASVAPTVVAEGEVCREDMARVVAAAALWEKTRGEVLHVGNVAGSPPVDIGAQLASVLS